MAASPKDKFEAAVKVIRGLPKNGSFQPSHDLMLKFYSYFKQATEGPCRSPKPAFWDLVSKKKWEAWSNLGDMQKEEAMLSYVDELKKVSIDVREKYYPRQIVETMPQTDAVTEFLQKLDNFYEMVEDSENHNTLKIVDKPRLNGSIASENGDEGDQPASYRVTQLLKHDVKCWMDNPGLLTGSKNVTNGHGLRFEHNENGRSFEHVESDEDDGDDDYGDDDEEDDDRDEHVRQKNGLMEEQLSPDVSHDGWDQVDESRLSVSHSDSSRETESESEEFCDTSDDPVELAIPSSSHAFVSCLPPLAEKSSTSTPANGGKFVHFSPRVVDFDAADSLAQNTSQGDTNIADQPVDQQLVPAAWNQLADVQLAGDQLADVQLAGDQLADVQLAGDQLADVQLADDQLADVQLAETLPTVALSDPGDTDELDILICRGGDEPGRDRRRIGGGHGAREGGSSASRDSHSGSGEAGGSNSAGGGQRDFFSGPGGGGGWRGAGTGGNMSPMDLNEQIVVTLLRLQHDMSGVLNRLNSLEALVKEGKKDKDKTVKIRKSWWPFPDLSVKSALIIFVWPLMVHCIITYINHRRRKLRR